MHRHGGTEFQRSEAFLVGALLAVAGGFLDAYTYLSRGGVFANAETGNLVLLGIYLIQGHWRQAAAYLCPILSFALGILAAECIRRHHRGGGRYHWRHTVLAVEILVVVLSSCLPLGRWDYLVNVLVPFVCSMQVEAFRKVRGYPFASTMCTGNLRSGTEALYHGILERNPQEMEKSLCYYGIILCFLAGAALGSFLTGIAPQRSILCAAAFQLAAFLMMKGPDGGHRSARRQ